MLLYSYLNVAYVIVFAFVCVCVYASSQSVCYICVFSSPLSPLHCFLLPLTIAFLGALVHRCLVNCYVKNIYCSYMCTVDFKCGQV